MFNFCGPQKELDKRGKNVIFFWFHDFNIKWLLRIYLIIHHWSLYIVCNWSAFILFFFSFLVFLEKIGLSKGIGLICTRNIDPLGLIKNVDPLGFFKNIGCCSWKCVFPHHIMYFLTLYVSIQSKICSPWVVQSHQISLQWIFVWKWWFKNNGQKATEKKDTTTK